MACLISCFITAIKKQLYLCMCCLAICTQEKRTINRKTATIGKGGWWAKWLAACQLPIIKPYASPLSICLCVSQNGSHAESGCTYLFGYRLLEFGLFMVLNHWIHLTVSSSVTILHYGICPHINLQQNILNKSNLQQLLTMLSCKLSPKHWDLFKSLHIKLSYTELLHLSIFFYAIK